MAQFGTWGLVSITGGITRIAISVFVLTIVILLYCGWRSSSPLPRVGLVAFGALSGLVRGATGVRRPLPVVSMALARPGSVKRQRARVIDVVTSLTIASRSLLA